MTDLVQDYTIGQDSVRIGVAIFGDDVQPIFQLNQYNTKQDVINAINQIPFLDQTTNTAAAIKYMREVMFRPENGDRPGIPNSAIIITDGVPRVPVDENQARAVTLQEASLARSQGINMFAVGIGPELTVNFLSQIATQVFQVDQIRDLENILNQVASATCVSTPPNFPPAPDPTAGRTFIKLSK